MKTNKRTISAATATLVILSLLALKGCGFSGEFSMSCSPPPQIMSTPPTQAVVGQQYRYVIEAIHECGLLPASCKDVSILEKPAGADYTPYNGLITWTPSPSQVNSSVRFSIATVPDYCGNSVSQTWTVYVLPVAPDITPPAIGSVYPANVAVNVPVNSKINASFNEPVNPQTATTTSFSVSGPSGPIAGNVLVSGGNVTFTPSVNLPISSSIAVTITTAVKDLAGNALASNYSWNFVTGVAPDNNPPAVPNNLSAIHITGSAVDLSWSSSVDDFAVAGYRIYRDGIYLQSVSGASFTDTSPSLGSLYCYQVTAIDSVTNESAKSIEACASTAWPSVVTNLGYSIGTVGDKGKTSLAIDSAYKAHISYYDDTNKYLYYATNNVGVWTILKIDSGVYGSPSLAVDASNKVHISYPSDGIYSLKYATNASGSWVISTVDANWVGLFPSLAIDLFGKAHIGYYDNQNGYLKYATNISGSWVVNTIDTGSVGTSTSLALDSTGKAHISYYDALNGNLKYATNATGAWVISTIESSGDVGSSTSLAVDLADKVHISYYDATNRDLKYATNAAGTWVTSIIDVGGTFGTGWQPSLALDTTGNIYISYHDWGNDNLLYATNCSGIWKVFVLASSPNGAGASSIKLDATGRVHISSQQSTNIIYSTY